MRETWVWSLGWDDPLEKGKATYSSILAWRIPWTIQSVGSPRAGQDWAAFTFTHRTFTKIDFIHHMCVCVHLIMFDSLRPHELEPTRLLCPCNFLGKNTRLDCHFLLQRIFLTQGSNPDLLTASPTLAGRFFTTWATWEAFTSYTRSHKNHSNILKHDFFIYAIWS